MIEALTKIIIPITAVALGLGGKSRREVVSALRYVSSLYRVRVSDLEFSIQQRKVSEGSEDARTVEQFAIARVDWSAAPADFGKKALGRS
jgi:hypothetical protein